MLVAKPPVAARGDVKSLVVLADIGKQRLSFMLINQSAQRNGNQQINPVGPVHGFSHAVLAVFGTAMRMPTQGEEGGFTGVADKDDIATFSPIAAIRSALGNEFLTTKTEAT